MQAKYENGEYHVTLSPAEAHVLIWGGAEAVVDALDWDLRHVLVAVEDEQLTNDEYNAAVAAVDQLPTTATVSVPDAD